jgi:hypothetical protein
MTVLRKIEILYADGVRTATLPDLFEEAIRLARVERLDEATTIAALEEIAVAQGLVLTRLPSEAPNRPLRLWLQGPA